jgi:deoxyribonuclease V
MTTGVTQVELAISHPWDLSTSEAKALQPRLAEQVISATTFDPASIRTVAGVDVGFKGGIARAAVIVISFPQLEPVDHALAETEANFPYVPGLLTFREGPSVLAACEKLSIWPDLFIFDGHGVAHPRRIGLAAHMGVILDWPSIGCAKSRLVGTHAEPGDVKGDWVPLYDKSTVIGAVVRSRPGVKPLYISTGHRIDLPTAMQLTLSCTRQYRLPETTRYAHKVAGGMKLLIEHSQPALL